MKQEESAPPTVLYISVTGKAALSNAAGSTHEIPVLVEYGWNNATESLFVRRVVRQDAGHFGERLL